MSCAAKTSLNSGCIHLPVAPRANLRRRFGEPDNPGRALSAELVTQWVERVLADGVPLSSATVSGPGEPLAEPAPVLDALRALRAARPELVLSLVTSGLYDQGADMRTLAAQFAEAGISRVTVLVDGVDPAVVEQVFAWIRPGRRTLPLPEASLALIDAQAATIRAFHEAGVEIVARMTLYAGINDAHVEDVAAAVAALGAARLELTPFAPGKTAPVKPAVQGGCSPSACATCGTASFCASKPPAPKPDEAEDAEDALPGLAPERLDELSAAAGRYLPVASACDPCATDILWVEGQGEAAAITGVSALPHPKGERVNVAVASSNGVDVDLHLGQTYKFLIFGPRAEDALPSLLGVREAPEPGGGDQRWVDLGRTLGDCFAVLVASAGAHPREVLTAQGVTVLTAETDVKAAVDVLFGGGKPTRRRVKID